MDSVRTALSVTVGHIGSDRAVVAVGGELDIDTGVLLHHQLAAQVTEGRIHLVLDLDGVPFMDSSGLNIVLHAARETRQCGGSLVLARPAPQVRHLLDLTGVLLSVPVCDDLDDAPVLSAAGERVRA